MALQQQLLKSGMNIQTVTLYGIFKAPNSAVMTWQVQILMGGTWTCSINTIIMQVSCKKEMGIRCIWSTSHRYIYIYAWIFGTCYTIFYRYDVVVPWYNETMLLIGRHYNNGKRRPKVYGLCLTRLFKWPSWQTKIIRSEINHCCPRWSPLRCWLQHHSKNKSRFYRENYPQAKVSYFLFPLYHFIGYLCPELKWGYSWFWA